MIKESMFQSTPPRRGDSRSFAVKPYLTTFQSTPPRRGDRPSRMRSNLWLKFQSTPPRRGDGPDARRIRGIGAFQSTPPRRGDKTVFVPFTVTVGFNPRPREGATNRAGRAADGERVSIHAPAKGRLGTLYLYLQRHRFQSTPPRRGDKLEAAQWCDRNGFNPRPREGATKLAALEVFTVGKFQSTPPRRGDRGSIGTGRGRRMFQSTPPRRGDARKEIFPCQVLRFNPRPREGATSREINSSSTICCFNPRPREGATRAWNPTLVPFRVSIHAPAKGRLEIRLAGLGTADVSIHAPAKGRPGLAPGMGSQAKFQSTPPRRGDQRSLSCCTSR